MSDNDKLLEQDLVHDELHISNSDIRHHSKCHIYSSKVGVTTPEE